jgi:hypothetical protein
MRLCEYHTPPLGKYPNDPVRIAAIHTDPMRVSFSKILYIDNSMNKCDVKVKAILYRTCLMYTRVMLHISPSKI